MRSMLLRNGSPRRVTLVAYCIGYYIRKVGVLYKKHMGSVSPPCLQKWKLYEHT